jgi:hypothetical protein
MFAASKTATVSTSTTSEPNGVDFNGFTDNDNLSSSISVSTQKLTVSFWIYSFSTSSHVIRSSNNDFKITVGTQVAINYAPAGTTRLNYSGGEALPLYTWNHVLISIDTTLASSNSKIYCNDQEMAGTWTTFTANTTISASNLAINGFSTASSRLDGRLSNVFIKSSYYSLATTSNRRQFITADRKPADGQSALTPVVYLPMSDATTVATNLGTGGSFTLSGVVARSGRGPNQYNAYYNTFTSYPSYLQKDSVTTIADSKTFTFHCVCKPTTTGQSMLFHIYDYDTGGTIFQIYTNSNRFYIYGQSGGSVIISASSPAILAINRNFTIDVSIDMSNTAKRFVYINGQAVTMTWTVYNNSALSYFGSYSFNVGGQNNGSGSATNIFLGQIGDLWFNTSYIDLSVPTNLSKFVTGTGIDALPVRLGATGELPTGSTPYIYLPLIGQNNSALKVGANFGSIGEFSAYGAGFAGAKGPCEFWGNKADFNGSTGYLKTTGALTGISDGKTLSASFWFQFDVSGNYEYLISIQDTSSQIQFEIWKNTSNQLEIAGAAGQLSVVLGGSALSINTPYFIQMCFDMTDTSKRFIYVNGSQNTPTWSSYGNNNFTFTTANYNSIGSRNTSYKLDGKMSEFYLTTQYIDFSLEANRLKFRDTFGNPTNISAAITAQSVPNPSIYLRFDPAAQGTNAGTGGNFTKFGTISDGGQL